MPMVCPTRLIRGSSPTPSLVGAPILALRNLSGGGVPATPHGAQSVCPKITVQKPEDATVSETLGSRRLSPVPSLTIGEEGQEAQWEKSRRGL